MAAPGVDEDVRRALDALSGRGLLLLHDARCPSLTTLVAGRPVKGSWWGHPAGRRIFQVAGALEDGGEVLFVPLVNGKVTLLHRRLWPALVAVGEAGEPWQTEGLSRESRILLEQVAREGRVRVTGKPAKLLCARLLLHCEQVHTERGAHATELVSWPEFRSSRAIGVLPRPAESRRSLEEAAAALGPGCRLPWQRPA